MYVDIMFGLTTSSIDVKLKVRLCIEPNSTEPLDTRKISI